MADEWNEKEIARQIRETRNQNDLLPRGRHFGFNHLIKIVEQRRNQQQHAELQPQQEQQRAPRGNLNDLIVSTESGSRADNFTQLDNPERYLLLPIQTQHSCFVLRRTSFLRAKRLQIEETRFRATVRTRPTTTTALRLSNLGGALYNLFSFLYTQTYETHLVSSMRLW